MKIKKPILVLFLILLSITSINASKIDKILKEGQLLYRLERGSWYGTDDFLERFPEKQNLIGGYLSYEAANNKINTIFFTKDNPTKIIVRYVFDSIPNMKPLSFDTVNTTTTELEKDLITIRTDALNRINENKDNFFSFYKKTSLNTIPLIYENKRKVYLITASNEQGVFVLGNDYLLEYSKKNTFKSQKKLHNTLIKLNYGSDENGNVITSTIHSHVINDYIDVTDICSLLLYREYTGWDQHYVISNKYITIFDLKKEIISVMTVKVWEKIMNNNSFLDKSVNESKKMK